MNLALYSSIYENLIVIGNSSVETDNNTKSIFCGTFDIASLNNEPTCYKTPENQPALIYINK